MSDLVEALAELRKAMEAQVEVLKQLNEQAIAPKQERYCNND